MSQQAFTFGHPIVTIESQDAPIDWSIYLRLDGSVPGELNRGKCQYCGKDKVSIMRWIRDKGYLVEYLCIGNKSSECSGRWVL